jgi:hypothetical protein
MRAAPGELRDSMTLAGKDYKPIAILYVQYSIFKILHKELNKRNYYETGCESSQSSIYCERKTNE